MLRYARRSLKFRTNDAHTRRKTAGFTLQLIGGLGGVLYAEMHAQSETKRVCGGLE